MASWDYKTSTTGYYDRHAAEFFENTFTVDVSALYVPFLRVIPEGGAILDAGCGSGRDTLAFLRKGYRVVSIDASREMVAAETKHTGQQALLLTFDEIDFTDEFDGIWACGSLVHVGRRDLPSVFTRFSRALKPNGVTYLSFKYGDTERMARHRPKLAADCHSPWGERQNRGESLRARCGKTLLERDRNQ